MFGWIRKLPKPWPSTPRTNEFFAHLREIHDHIIDEEVVKLCDRYVPSFGELSAEQRMLYTAYVRKCVDTGVIMNIKGEGDTDRLIFEAAEARLARSDHALQALDPDLAVLTRQSIKAGIDHLNARRGKRPDPTPDS